MRSFTIAMTMFFLLTMVYVWQHFSAIEVGYPKGQRGAEDGAGGAAARGEQTATGADGGRNAEGDPGRIDGDVPKQLGLDTPQPGQVVRQDGMSGTTAVMAQARIPGAACELTDRPVELTAIAAQSRLSTNNGELRRWEQEFPDEMKQTSRQNDLPRVILAGCGLSMSRCYFCFWRRTCAICFIGVSLAAGDAALLDLDGSRAKQQQKRDV